MNLNFTIGDGTIKMTVVSFTKTHITLLQHIAINLPCNNCHSYISLTEICCFHHKPLLQGVNKAKLRGWIGTSYKAKYIADPGPVQCRMKDDEFAYPTLNLLAVIEWVLSKAILEIGNSVVSDNARNMEVAVREALSVFPTHY